jgi:hypothetical protein
MKLPRPVSLSEGGAPGRLLKNQRSENKGLSWRRMRPEPAPNVPGNTEAERMDNAVRKMFSVSKEDLLKAEAKWKRSRALKKSPKKTKAF